MRDHHHHDPPKHPDHDYNNADHDDIDHNHNLHHHHNQLGNILTCPNDHCLAGLVNSGLARHFDRDFDVSTQFRFGPAEHDHDKPADIPTASTPEHALATVLYDFDCAPFKPPHIHDWHRIDKTRINQYYLCDCGAHRFEPLTADTPAQA